MYKKCNYQCEILCEHACVTIAMSILKYFHPVKQKLVQELYVLDPNGSLNKIMPSLAVSSANTKVLRNKQLIVMGSGHYKFPFHGSIHCRILHFLINMILCTTVLIEN